MRDALSYMSSAVPWQRRSTHTARQNPCCQRPLRRGPDRQSVRRHPSGLDEHASRVPPEDFYQLIFEFPKQRFLHTPSFVGMHYTDDLIILDLAFIEGRAKETRFSR